MIHPLQLIATYYVNQSRFYYFLSFSIIMSFLCFRIPNQSTMLHFAAAYFIFPSHDSLCQTLLVFVMIWQLWGGPVKWFVVLPHYWSMSRVFFMIKLRSWVIRRKTTEIKGHSNHIEITLWLWLIPVNVGLDHLAEEMFVRSSHREATFSFFTAHFGRKSERFINKSHIRSSSFLLLLLCQASFLCLWTKGNMGLQLFSLQF